MSEYLEGEPGRARESYTESFLNTLRKYSVPLGVAAVGAVLWYALRDKDSKNTSVRNEKLEQSERKKAEGLLKAGLSGSVSTLPVGKALKAGNWLASPNGKYYVFLTSRGSLELYEGKDPSDAQSLLLWSSGPRDFDQDLGTYAIVETKDNIANLNIYVGVDDSKRGPRLWSTQRTVPSPEGSVITLQVTNEGTLALKSDKQGGVDLWTRYQSSNVLEPGVPLNTDEYLQSHNGHWFAHQSDDGRLSVYHANSPDWAPLLPKASYTTTSAGPTGKYFTTIDKDTGKLSTYQGSFTSPSDQNKLYWQGEAVLGPNNPGPFYLMLMNDGGLAVNSKSDPSKKTRISDRGATHPTAIKTSASVVRRDAVPISATHNAMGIRRGEISPSPVKIATMRGKTSGASRISPIRGPAFNPSGATTSTALSKNTVPKSVFDVTTPPGGPSTMRAAQQPVTLTAGSVNAPTLSPAMIANRKSQMFRNPNMTLSVGSPAPIPGSHGRTVISPTKLSAPLPPTRGVFD